MAAFVLLLALGLFLGVLLCLFPRAATSPSRRRRLGPGQKAGHSALATPKPEWVHREVLRLKALLPAHGCRKIATVFNHLHHRRGQSVGKTFVASALRGRQQEILRLRQHLKHRKPRPVPRNLVWALDLTFLPDPARPRAVLGLLDHGSRACLTLRELRTRTAVALLRALLDAIERFGTPRSLRTDNDPVFTSRLFRFGLFLLAIRHQRIAPFAPWQNGRIERFFGTFKDRILPWLQSAGVADDLAPDLAAFRAWYNHARPHHHLAGLTPALAWAGRQPGGKPRYFSEWNGLLTGFFWPS